MAGKPKRRATARSLIEAEIRPTNPADAANVRMIAAKQGVILSTPRMYNLRDLVDLCRGETAEAVATILAIGRSEESPPMVRLAAWNMLLDRGYGRPHQSIAVADNTNRGVLNYSALSDDELRQLEALLSKAATPTKG